MYVYILSRYPNFAKVECSVEDLRQAACVLLISIHMSQLCSMARSQPWFEPAGLHELKIHTAGL